MDTTDSQQAGDTNLIPAHFALGRQETAIASASKPCKHPLPSEPTIRFSIPIAANSGATVAVEIPPSSIPESLRVLARVLGRQAAAAWVKSIAQSLTQ